MKRHASRADSGYLQVKIRVPTDVRDRARGRRLSVVFPATATEPESTFTVTLGEFCKGSLQTRDARIADIRIHAVRAALMAFCDILRSGTVELTQRQIEALAGDVHRHLLAEHGDNPGTPREWESFKALTRAAVEGKIPGAPPIPERGRSDDEVMRELLFGETEGESLTETINGMPATWEARALEQRVGRLAYWALQSRGIEVDSETRLRLLRRIAVAALQAGGTLKRMAGGDFRPDPAAERFPPYQDMCKAAVSLSDIFDRWQRETKPAGSTLTTWRGILADFKRHLKHDDAIRVTDQDMVAWKDARIAAGRSLKTVADSDLACIRRLYAFAIGNKLVDRNPAEGIKVAVKKMAGTGRIPYTHDDIARLLRHAEGEGADYRRWLPILLATTGARVGELTQLSADRVRIEDGVHVLRIEPAADGGSLKNEGSERTVPMHPALIDSGFIDFARSKNGPLFYGSRPKRGARSDGEGRHASKSVANRLSDWIRTLPGFDDPRKGPAHSARHWWKSTALRSGMADSVADHLQGHAASGVAGRYRHHDDLRFLAAEVARIPIPLMKRAGGEALLTEADIAPILEPIEQS
ncbi:Integrase family protein [Methylobacterium oryzae CBMB20]|uniref:Integrase family protein n=2 Tax=Methylobacterium oryzae TaxID=334852 RepID=A0A089NMT8_9HYPH|nr:Integrase family protein [Methylobacterium oryzae CBMB20]